MSFKRAHPQLKWRGVSTLLVAALTLSGCESRATGGQSPATDHPPATQSTAQPVSANRSPKEIIADLTENASRVRDLTTNPQTMSDAAARTAAAPQAIPALKRMYADMEQLKQVNPSDSGQADEAQAEYLVFMSVFGDAAAAEQLQQLSNSKDPATALRGQGSQLVARWILAGKDSALQAKIVDEAEKLAAAHPDSEWLTAQLVTMSNMELTAAASRTRFINLVVDVMHNAVADSAKQEVVMDRKVEGLVGHPLAIAGKMIDGKDFTTADWKGKVVLVDFWATWCPMCRVEMPSVKQAYADHHAAGLEVVGVNSDYSPDEVKQYTTSNQLPWPQLFDAQAAAQQQWNSLPLQLGVHKLPTMFLIDKKGIVRSVMADEDLDATVTARLRE